MNMVKDFSKCHDRHDMQLETNEEFFLNAIYLAYFINIAKEITGLIEECSMLPLTFVEVKYLNV